MRKLFDHKLTIFLIAATIILAVVIGVFSAKNRGSSAVENIGGGTAATMQEAVSDTGSWFGNIFNYFGNIKKLKAENEQLKNENTNLQKQIRDMDGLDSENSELRKMLDLKKTQTKVDMVAASIVAKDPSNWYSVFTINKGTKDGIEKNQAVVNSNRQLVGQISGVGDSWAEVITILDSQSSIGAEISRSAEIGIIEGDASLRYSGQCRLGYIARDTDIQIGDFIQTSGLGGIFPKGLIIGTVEDIYEENSTMSKAATIKPLADIARINEVFVITDYKEMDLSESIESGNSNKSGGSDSEDEDSSDDEDE